MKQGKNGTFLSYTLLIITFVIWGSLYVASKTALADLSPTALLFFRYFLGLFPLFVLYRREKKQTRIRRGDWKYFLFIGGVGYFAAIMLQTLGTNLASASMASLINSMNPVAVTFLAAVFLKESLTPRKLAAVLLAVAGVLVIFGKSGSAASPAGILCSVVSVILWSLTMIAVRKISSRYSPIQITFWSMAVGLVFTTPFFAAETLQNPLSIRPSSAAAVVYIALICTGLAQLLWNRSLAFLNAGTCSMFYPLQPVTSTLFGVLFLGEKLTVSFLLGGAVIICGILISQLSLPDHREAERRILTKYSHTA